MILLIDANNLAHRARHAYQLSFRGTDTSVTYGFVRVLMSYLNKYKPEACLVAWDYGVPHYRKAAYPKYKANRNHDADDTFADFMRQVHELETVLTHLGVAQAVRPGIEADDLLYHASRLALDKCMIVSNDADLLQAVTTRVTVLKPGKAADIIIDINNFKQQVGVDLNNYMLYRVLQGDSSDNIGGCPGVGPVTARKLLRDLDGADLSAVIEHAKGAIKARLSFYQETNYAAIYKVMRLTNDLCGARQAVLSCSWNRFDKQYFTRWCMSNGFASLLGEAGSSSQLFGQLTRPRFETANWRTPKVWDYVRLAV